MADGDAVQLGTQWKIGFGGASYTGYDPEDIEESKGANAEEIPDGRNATQSVILTNPHSTLKGTWKIKETGGSLTPPKPGDTISMTPPSGSVAVSYRCRSASVKSGISIAKLTLDLIKEDAMTYT